MSCSAAANGEWNNILSMSYDEVSSLKYCNTLDDDTSLLFRSIALEYAFYASGNCKKISILRT
jgi:hypothetical protein